MRCVCSVSLCIRGSISGFCASLALQIIVNVRTISSLKRFLGGDLGLEVGARGRSLNIVCGAWGVCFGRSGFPGLAHCKGHA